MALVTTRAVLLRSFPYSETSRVLHFYTDALGGVGVMGKGVRAGGGKEGTGLDSFAEGTLTLYTKPTRDLQTLREFAPTRPRRPLAADVRRFGGAAVLAELVLKHAGEEPSPTLFDALSGALDRLAGVSADAVVPTLLREGWLVVSTLGYRPVVDACVECGRPLGEELARFDFAAGGIRCPGCAREQAGPRLGPGARAQLSALLDGYAELPTLERPRAHLRLLSDFVTWHLSGGRPLASFEVLAGLLPSAGNRPGPDPVQADEGSSKG
jgi:DNA repair protein RecO (recombination protein O)